MRTATVAAAAAFLLAGCTVSVVTGPGAEETVDLEVDAPDAKALVVDGQAGSIDAGPGERPAAVTVHAVKRAPKPEDLARIRVHAMAHGDEVRVGYEVEGEEDGISVSFTVAAPASFQARLRTGAGSIRAEGFRGGVEVRTGAGSVETTGVGGDQDIETSAGSVRVSGADGCVQAKSSAGSIRASGRLRGASSLETSAGSIEVYLHPDARLKVSGKTSAGGVRTDFPLSVKGEFAGKEVGGTLGDGSDGSLRIESSAGSITIRKQ